MQRHSKRNIRFITLSAGLVLAVTTAALAGGSSGYTPGLLRDDRFIPNADFPFGKPGYNPNQEFSHVDIPEVALTGGGGGGSGVGGAFAPPADLNPGVAIGSDPFEPLSARDRNPGIGLDGGFIPAGSNPVPAPGAAVLISLAGLAGLRRRR